VPQVLMGFVSLLRVGSIAPDLLRAWHRPHWAAIRQLFTEGTGSWIGGWGWRLFSASDGLVLASMGRPTAVAALAFTNKLAQALTQLSWVPCDSGLPGPRISRVNIPGPGCARPSSSWSASILRWPVRSRVSSSR
jgi:hypothetical protein